MRGSKFLIGVAALLFLVFGFFSLGVAALSGGTDAPAPGALGDPSPSAWRFGVLGVAYLLGALLAWRGLRRARVGAQVDAAAATAATLLIAVLCSAAAYFVDDSLVGPVHYLGVRMSETALIVFAAASVAAAIALAATLTRFAHP